MDEHYRMQHRGASKLPPITWATPDLGETDQPRDKVLSRREFCALGRLPLQHLTKLGSHYDRKHTFVFNRLYRLTDFCRMDSLLP